MTKKKDGMGVFRWLSHCFRRQTIRCLSTRAKIVYGKQITRDIEELSQQLKLNARDLLKNIKIDQILKSINIFNKRSINTKKAP